MRTRIVIAFGIIGAAALAIYILSLQRQGVRRGSRRAPGGVLSDAPAPPVVSLTDPFVPSAEYLEASSRIESIL